MRPSAKDGAGFTLIELMIVVAIIGILAGIAIPKFADLLRKSNEGATKGNLGTLRSALTIYYGDMEGIYPGDDLSSLTVNAKYISAIPAAKTSFHESNSVVCVTLLNIAGGCRMGLGAPAAWDGQIGGAVWAYVEQSEQALMFGVNRYKGDVWIGCQHTDTRGTVWSAY